MELHCSQTECYSADNLTWFETPMELHCSQTTLGIFMNGSLFETPMELHCSQTVMKSIEIFDGLRPLWNYTALKHRSRQQRERASLRPLWNYTALKRVNLLPFRTCLFETPMELHCSQTSLIDRTIDDTFETPMELHCSQT